MSKQNSFILITSLVLLRVRTGGLFCNNNEAYRTMDILPSENAYPHYLLTTTIQLFMQKYIEVNKKKGNIMPPLKAVDHP